MIKGGHRARSSAGFTLLEVIIAVAILGVSLVAVHAINGGALSMHAYAKRLTVATMLARSKVADVESKLQSDGLPADDETEEGDFDEEGFPTYKWKAEIIRPKTEDISTDALLSMFGMGGDADSANSNNPLSALTGGAGGAAAAAGGGQMLAGAMQMQLQTMMKQLGDTLREVRVTVYWPDGKKMDSFTVVTHVVSLGPGTDQLQSAQAAPGTPQMGAPTPPVAPGTPPIQMPRSPNGLNLPTWMNGQRLGVPGPRGVK